MLAGGMVDHGPGEIPLVDLGVGTNSSSSFSESSLRLIIAALLLSLVGGATLSCDLSLPIS